MALNVPIMCCHLLCLAFQTCPLFQNFLSSPSNTWNGRYFPCQIIPPFRLTADGLVVDSRDSPIVVISKLSRRLRVLLTTQSTCSGEIFWLKVRSWDKVPEGSAVILGTHFAVFLHSRNNNFNFVFSIIWLSFTHTFTICIYVHWKRINT